MSVKTERDREVAVVVLDHPPVNAIDQAMRQGLLDAAERLDADEDVRAVVLIAAGGTFIAGADIAEFDRPPEPPHLPEVVARIESASVPWIAAIHGTALGGGLEIALGCRFRVAVASARLGLPEVTLGLVPGSGGTVRLPRLVPPEAAVRLVTTGRPVSASEAAELGLVDAIVEGELRKEAVAFARAALDRPLPERTLARARVGKANADFWAEHQSATARRARGQHSPQRALQCLRGAYEDDPAEALAAERATFLELRCSEQARALRHVFFAERAAARPPEIADLRPRPVGSAAVVGGGTMGAGIAVALWDAGLPVILVERDAEASERARKNFDRILEGLVRRGHLGAGERARHVAGVRFETDYAALGEADVVIEAVFEDLEVKRGVFARLDEACRADAVLATNTSYLDPNAIAAATARPERVIGTHFFSPANVMKLLEIVPADATAPDVTATAFRLAKMLRKIPVLAGICEGFIGNRLLRIQRAQAERLLLAGYTPAAIDQAMREFGMAMGPFEAQDLSGLDIAAAQRQSARGRGERALAPVADALVKMGRLGQKTGGGWYDYIEGERTPHPSSVVAQVVSEQSGKVSVKRRKTAGMELADLVIFPMIDEAARILDEGIARRATDIDLVEVLGYGFPRWRGGLAYYACTRGLADIVSTLDSMEADGLADSTSDALRQLARDEGCS